MLHRTLDGNARGIENRAPFSPLRRVARLRRGSTRESVQRNRDGSRE